MHQGLISYRRFVENQKVSHFLLTPQILGSGEILIPINVTNTDTPVDPNRKVIYRKIHKYGKKEYLVEISKNKIKYFILSIRLKKDQKTQMLEYHYKQGKRLIKAAGGVDALADKIKFKYGSLAIQDLNKLLYSTNDNTSSYKEISSVKKKSARY